MVSKVGGNAACARLLGLKPLTRMLITGKSRCASHVENVRGLHVYCAAYRVLGQTGLVLCKNRLADLQSHQDVNTSC